MSTSMRLRFGPCLTSSSCLSRRQVAQPRLQPIKASWATGPVAIWTRPTPNRDEEFIKPSWVPQPNTQPDWSQPGREEGPLYAPAPEFRPAEVPDKQDVELPSAPKMPERRPDPIPAGNPKKEKPPQEDDKREAPPPKTNESPKQ